MRKQKGQAIVEFALVFPLMLLFLWGMLYGGLLFKDYLTLSNLARDSARMASIQGKAQYETIRTNGVQWVNGEGGANQKLLTDLYTWKGDGESFRIADDEAKNSVQVTITTNLNTSFPGVGFLDFLGIPLPANYRIIYSMHKETT